MKSNPTKKTEEKCKIPECTNYARYKVAQLCNKHYAKVNGYTRSRVSIKWKRKKQAEGFCWSCPKPRVNAVYCEYHRQKSVDRRHKWGERIKLSQSTAT